ncbi:hypothetical protein VTO42DRAFT_5907 [Malbranchea cinnamomea]
MATRIPPPARGAGMRPRPVQRLTSLKNPNPSPFATPPPKPTTHPKTTTCPNPGCPAPNIVEDDGQKVCSGCGTVISEANIVSEVTFGETSSGAAIVQGTFVGADQTHGRSTGPGFQRGGGMESREITEQNGNRYIAQLCRALNIPESAQKAAGQVFKLAVGLNFIQGRRTKTVAAVCLYVACRRQDGNTVMLIDFADVLMINVFKLGRTYKALLEELRLGGNVFIMNPIDPESLIYRFAKQLEFGSQTMQVASEAVRIVQRMNRDWMITGRRPAGICGAALILAARMNNFRRTVREVVYVVKVTELTIHQRLNEFKATESGDLTVDQFRTVDLEHSHDPPAYTRARMGSNKRRRGQAQATAAEIEGGEEEPTQTATPPGSSASPPAPKRPRIDADGFVIPDIPIDPALLAMQSEKANESESTARSDGGNDEADPSRGRLKVSRTRKLPPPTEADIARENELENEMQELLSSGSNLVASAAAPHPQPPRLIGKDSSPTPDAEDTVQPTPRVRKPVSESETIDPTEFDSDPEVQYCLLSPDEVEVKERIWVHENKDYLRAQQAKALKRALAAADFHGGHVPKPRKRRKGRMGDVGYLNGGADGKSSRASTPAEATRMMLEKRGFSKKINYKLLEEMYEDETDAKGKEPADDADFVKERESDNGRARSRSRSVSVVSERSYGGGREPSFGGGQGRMSARTKLLKGARAARAVAATGRPRPFGTMSPSPRASPARTPVPPRVPPARQPVPAHEPEPAPEPEHPSNPDEEILGYIPGPEPGEEEEGRTYELEDEDEDEDEDEEGEDEDEDERRIQAAFAGDYYDEGSDDGYDDDY